MQATLSYSQQELKTQQLEQATIDKAAKLFDQFGTLWIENVFPKALIQSLHENYLKEYAYPTGGGRHKHAIRVGNRRQMISVTIKPPFNDPALYAASLLYPILIKLLGDDCVIDSFGSVCSYPGAASQKVHADNPPLFADDAVCAGLPSYAITVAIPLIDIDTEIGTTAIWEGSHRQTNSENRIQTLQSSVNQSDFEDAVLPIPQAGGMYLMDYRLIHTGTPNQSKQARPLLYFVYSRAWFRDNHNFGDQRERAAIMNKENHDRIPAEYRHLFKGISRS